MSSGILVGAIVAIILLIGAAVLLWPAVRSRQLRSRFGPEYDRVLAESDDRRTAERELAERTRRHKLLELKALTPERKDYFARAWADVQEQFVDQPAEAVTDADRLVSTLMGERGYPTGSYDQQLADLSVEHAATLGHYREAHDIAIAQAEGRASTEDLRTAVVHYRTLFRELLDAPAKPGKVAKETGEHPRDAVAHEKVSVPDKENGDGHRATGEATRTHEPAPGADGEVRHATAPKDEARQAVVTKDDAAEGIPTDRSATEHADARKKDTVA